MSTEMDLLKQEIERAMDNAPLQKALKNFTTAYPGNRERVYKDTTLKPCGKRCTK